MVAKSKLKISSPLILILLISDKEKEDVEQLLHTVLVPAFPPNRSQWRKLEIAMKFINISKKSARETRMKKEQKYKVLKESENTENNDRGKKSNDGYNSFQLPSDDVDGVIKKDHHVKFKPNKRKKSRWKRIKHSLHQIM